jgi:hypothetical protein
MISAKIRQAGVNTHTGASSNDERFGFADYLCGMIQRFVASYRSFHTIPPSEVVLIITKRIRSFFLPNFFPGSLPALAV